MHLNTVTAVRICIFVPHDVTNVWQSSGKNLHPKGFFKTILCPGLAGSALRPIGCTLYNIGRMPGFEPKLLRLQPGVLPMSYTHPYNELHTSLNELHTSYGRSFKCRPSPLQRAVSGCRAWNNVYRANSTGPYNLKYRFRTASREFVNEIPGGIYVPQSNYTVQTLIWKYRHSYKCTGTQKRF